VADLPDQKQLWDAYGHAMGAATGVELLMRIALINVAADKLAKDGHLDQEHRSEALTKIQKMTFGQTVQAFKAAFSNFAEDKEFCESIGNAVSSRNHLAHHFLEGILLALRSTEGIELVVLSCVEYTDHFQSLDNYIRKNCPVDYDAFFKLGEGREDEFVQNHPLREKLIAIKEGKLRRDVSGR
jgi:hypothetical protein